MPGLIDGEAANLHAHSHRHQVPKLEKRVELALGRRPTNRAQVLRSSQRHREVPVAIVELGDRQLDLGNAGPRGALLDGRSEEHTSELQSRLHLVCRLLLEKKKKNNTQTEHKRQY